MRVKNLKMILATSKCGVIGFRNPVDGKFLPWKISTDMKRFRDLTVGNNGNNVVFMGRTTWDTIPEKFRPLPNRENFVLSRQEDLICPGATVISNKQEILDYAHNNPDRDVWITGGDQVYDLFFDDVCEIHWTCIDIVFPEDNNLVYLNGFYRLDSSQFQAMSTEKFSQSDKDQYDSEYIVLEGMEKPSASQFQQLYVDC